MTIRLVLADDEQLLRVGFRMILDAHDGFEVVAEAANGHEAVAAVAEHRPDVIVMDVRMPDLDGIAATETITRDHPDSRVLILTTFDLDEYVYAALRAGARGFLLKDAGPALLTQAVRAAAEGDALIAPNVTTRLLNAFAVAGPAAPPRQPIDPLTDREEQVLAAVARGRTNTEISAELHITLSTVKTHIASLMAKLGARNRVEVAMWAYETSRVRG